MKKIILVTQILVLVLFLAKIAALAGVMVKPEKVFNTPTSFENFQKKLSEESPVAQPEELMGTQPVKKGENPRDLYQALEAKRQELAKKEESLAAEEQRLEALKKEIVAKIDVLKMQEEKYLAAVESVSENDKKRLKDLAKIFEATPPAKAGIMLEQLDVKTAAGISMNMKRDKAGAIWGYLSPQKAVKITAEITRLERQGNN